MKFENANLKIKKRGRARKYPWGELKEAGDCFVLPEASKEDSKRVRAAAVFQNMQVSVKQVEPSGYVVILKGFINAKR